MQIGFLVIVLALILVGAYIAAGIPALMVVVIAFCVVAIVDHMKQRRRERREAKLDARIEALRADAEAKTAPLPKGERSALDVLREDPAYRPSEPTQGAPSAKEAPAPAQAEAPAPAGDTARVFPLMELGSWPQGPNGERERIQWIVFKQEEERTLALSLRILELRPFHGEAAPTRWEDSDLRRWLNDDFFDAAFTPEEQARICQPEPAEDPSGEMLWQMFGLETVTGQIDDKAFALNGSDLSEFFPGENSMFHPGCSAEPTPWVRTQAEGSPGEDSWWLRSSMQQMAMAYIASPADSMGVSAISPENLNGVRPAIWLRSQGGAA